MPIDYETGTDQKQKITTPRIESCKHRVAMTSPASLRERLG
jgi:hypothetical protein